MFSCPIFENSLMKPSKDSLLIDTPFTVAAVEAFGTVVHAVRPMSRALAMSDVRRVEMRVTGKLYCAEARSY